jgi:hypothetical protein
MLVDLLWAVIAAAGLSAVLILRRPSSAQLPDPSQVPDMPMAGPASPAAAHAAINRTKR